MASISSKLAAVMVLKSVLVTTDTVSVPVPVLASKILSPETTLLVLNT